VDHPPKTDPTREHRVRERAYHLWEADGKQHGRDIEFWERARELVAMEESAGSGPLPNPTTHLESGRETGTGEADIQDKLGEFPGGFAEPGEVRPTQTARRSPARRRKAPAPAKKPRKP
jgi:hypothetical protein